MITRTTVVNSLLWISGGLALACSLLIWSFGIGPVSSPVTEVSASEFNVLEKTGKTPRATVVVFAQDAFLIRDIKEQMDELYVVDVYVVDCKEPQSVARESEQDLKFY